MPGIISSPNPNVWGGARYNVSGELRPPSIHFSTAFYRTRPTNGKVRGIVYKSQRSPPSFHGLPHIFILTHVCLSFPHAYSCANKRKTMTPTVRSPRTSNSSTFPSASSAFLPAGAPKAHLRSLVHFRKPFEQ